MLDIPSRRVFAALTEAANAVASSVALGFARHLDDARVSVLYASSHGIGSLVVDIGDVLEALLPSTHGVLHADADTIQSNPLRAIEWTLLLVYSACSRCRFPILSRRHVFWVGLSDPNSPTTDQIVAFEAVAGWDFNAVNPPVVLPMTYAGPVPRTS